MNTYTPVTATNESLAVPGRKSTIARLIVLGAMTLIALVTSLGTLPGYISRQGFFPALWEAMAGCGTLLMTGAWLWVMIRWIGAIAPRSFRAACRFWNCWQCLTFFGLYIKGCLWLIICMVPPMLAGYGFTPVFLLALKVAQNGVTFFSGLMLLALGSLLTAALAFLDICKLRRLSPLQVLRSKFFSKE